MPANKELEMMAYALETTGLIDTCQQFPEDVLAAARAARNVRATLNPPEDNTLELWPAMRVKEVPCTG